MICFHPGSVLFAKSTPYKALNFTSAHRGPYSFIEQYYKQANIFSGGGGRGREGVQLVLRRFPPTPTQFHPARFCSYIHIDTGQFHSYYIIKPIVVIHLAIIII